MERFFLLCLALMMALPDQVQAALSGSVKFYNTTRYTEVDESYKNESVLARLVFTYRNENGFYANTRFFTRYNFVEDDFSKIKNYNYVGYSKRLNDNVAFDLGTISCLKYGCEIAGGKDSFDVTNLYVGSSLYKNTYVYFYFREKFISSLSPRYTLEVEHYIPTDTYTYGLGFWHIKSLKDGWDWDVVDKANQTIWVSVARKVKGITFEAHVRAETLKKGDWVLNSNTKPSLDLMVSKPFNI